MKILHISKYYHPIKGGMETFTKDLCEAQLEKGHSVKVLSYNTKNTNTEFTNINGIEVIRVKTELIFGYAPISFSFSKIFRESVGTFKPDIIFIHMPNFMPLLNNKICKKIPTVIYWHSDVDFSSSSLFLKLLYIPYSFLENKLLEKSAKIIATSDDYLDKSKTLKKHINKCEVLPLGIDTEKFSKTKEYKGLPEKYVLTVGRLTYYKGFQYLIEAFNLIKDNTDLYLLIVGNGDQKEALSRLISKFSLQKKVFILDNIDDAQKNFILQNCLFFCLPSISRAEAFGLSLLEAMYFKKALLTTRIEGSGINYVNIDGETGITVKPKNSKELSEAIAFLAKNPEKLNEYAGNAQRRFSNLFTIKRIIDQLDETCSNFNPEHN